MSNDVVMGYFPLYAVSCIYSSVSIIMIYEWSFQSLQLKILLIDWILKWNRKPVIISLYFLQKDKTRISPQGIDAPRVMLSGKLRFFLICKNIRDWRFNVLHNNSSTKPQSNYKKTFWIKRFRHSTLSQISSLGNRIKSIKLHLSLICFTHVSFKICWQICKTFVILHPIYVNKNTNVMRADEMDSNRSCKSNSTDNF